MTTSDDSLPPQASEDKLLNIKLFAPLALASLLATGAMAGTALTVGGNEDREATALQGAQVVGTHAGGEAD